MVQSSVKPPKIQIINIRDDIKNNKVNVKYAMNFNITEKQVEEAVIDENGNETTELKTIYEYYQYISEATFDLILKPLIPDLLKSIYTQLEPTINERLLLATQDLPKEIWEV